MVSIVNYQTTPFWISWCSILSQQQFSELNFSRSGRKTGEPGRKHHQIHHPTVHQVVTSILFPDTKEMVPHQEFNSRLAISIRNTGELPSEAVAKESASHWTLAEGICPDTQACYLWGQQMWSKYFMSQRGQKHFFGMVLETGTGLYVTSLLLIRKTKAVTLKPQEDSQKSLCAQHLEEWIYSPF